MRPVKQWKEGTSGGLNQQAAVDKGKNGRAMMAQQGRDNEPNTSRRVVCNRRASPICPEKKGRRSMLQQLGFEEPIG
jgi:hypothetical protein